MDSYELGRAQVDPRLERFLRRDVDRVGERARRVGADGQRGQIEGPQGLAGLLEVPVVTGVPGEVEALGAEHRPGRPQAPPLVDEGATRAVLCRRAHDGQARDGHRLAPVQLDDVRDATIL